MGKKDVVIIAVPNGTPLVLVGDVVPENPLKLLLVGSVCTIQIKPVHWIIPLGIVAVVEGDVVVDLGGGNGVIVVVIGSEPGSPVEGRDGVLDHSEQGDGCLLGNKTDFKTVTCTFHPAVIETPAAINFHIGVVSQSPTVVAIVPCTAIFVVNTSRCAGVIMEISIAVIPGQTGG